MAGSAPAVRPGGLSAGLLLAELYVELVLELASGTELGQDVSRGCWRGVLASEAPDGSALPATNHISNSKILTPSRWVGDTMSTVA